MKKFLKFVGGFLLFVIALLVLVFAVTGGMADRATAFLTAGGEGRISDAHAMMSEDARRSTSEEALAAFFRDSALGVVADASWSSRSMSGRRGELEGVATGINGASVPMKLVMVKEDDEWMVHSVQRSSAGLTESQIARNAAVLPSQAETMAIADNGMRLFASAVEQGSMDSFHEGISALWQEQISVEELDAAFAEFYAIEDFDWDQLRTLDPELEGPGELDEDGVLILSGHYLSQPYPIRFTQRFYREGATWKLLGLEVNM